MNIYDEEYMQHALSLAQRALLSGDVPVGAVVVRNNEIIGEGYNRRAVDGNATAHAEIIAINEACDRLSSWRLEDCTLYVTLEPCPMCAGAIINARLSRVVYGAADEKSGCAKSVINMFEMPFNHRPILRGGILEQQCSRLLSDFFADIRKE